MRPRQRNSMPIRIDSEEYMEAIRVKDAHKRNIQDQIGYWSKVGRYALANPELPVREVEKLVIEIGIKKHEGYAVG